MAKFIAQMKCTSRFCRENFKIEVDEKYSLKLMKMVCPRCFFDYVTRIPEAPKSAVPDPVEEEGILSDIFKTGEEFVTGAHATVRDVLGKIKRDMGAD